MADQNGVVEGGGMSDSNVLLEGIAVGGYRSFGSPQRIGPLRKINFFAGQNNSGKSNILRYIDGPAVRLTKVSPGTNLSFEAGDFDAHQVRSLNLCSALAFTPGGAIDCAVRGHHVMTRISVAAWSSIVSALAEDGMVWIPFVLVNNRDQSQLAFLTEWIEGALGRTSEIDWARFAETVSTRQSTKRQNVEIVVRWIVQEATPKVGSVLIPAVREISNDSEIKGDYSGRDLIHRLDQLQSPTAATYAENSERFEQINQFVASVTDTPDAAISIPHDRSTINVRLVPCQATFARLTSAASAWSWAWRLRQRM